MQRGVGLLYAVLGEGGAARLERDCWTQQQCTMAVPESEKAGEMGNGSLFQTNLADFGHMLFLKTVVCDLV